MAEEKIIKLDDKRIAISHDMKLTVSTAPRRDSVKWKNKTVTLSQLLKRLSESRDTGETVAEYKQMTKKQKADIKDVGGFVGGELIGGKRNGAHVKCRTLLTLDADESAKGLPDKLQLIVDYFFILYTTHSHTKRAPRYRIVAPLSREVTPDEYKALSRLAASDLGMECFDPKSFAPEQLMFWASHPTDIEPVFDYADLPPLDVDKMLARYKDWRDITEWPESPREEKERKKLADKQQDPLTKSGIVGDFCRTYYPISDAIETFLSDVYEPTAKEDRYTYREGSTYGGAVIYDDRFLYSNHATDPASGQTCNAFDLVRIHRFGDLDEEGQSGAKAPSFAAMAEFAQNDEAVIRHYAEERMKEAADDFSESPQEEDVSWQSKLERKARSMIVANTLQNLTLIMEHDPVCQAARYNAFADRIEITGDVPWEHGRFWRDADDAQLESYLLKHGEFSKAKIETAFMKAVDDRSFHPVLEFLRGLPEWDGTPRVDTLLIDYLGAEDNTYTRAVMRKTLCAAVKRVYSPGCKFDYMLTLVGPQGIGKSTLAARLGGEWFSDSLSLSDTRDKTAAEKLQGNWIIEIGELAGIRKMDVETLKSFLSRQDDKYRASYGKRVQSHPRQCVFIGTTNAEEGFLRDATGGRRFWPVFVPGAVGRGPWELTEKDVEQIWAETLQLVKQGEKLVLDKEDEQYAEEGQKQAIEADPRAGLVQKYLDKKLPCDWDSRSLEERREWLEGDNEDDPLEPGEEERTTVSNIEIWAECFGMDPAKMQHKDSYQISTIMSSIAGWERTNVRKRIPIYGQQRLYDRKVRQASDKKSCHHKK